MFYIRLLLTLIISISILAHTTLYIVPVVLILFATVLFNANKSTRYNERVNFRAILFTIVISTVVFISTLIHHL